MLTCSVSRFEALSSSTVANMATIPWTRWLVAAGVIAGLALPAVGTYYVLRKQYPEDPFILALTLTSWALVFAAFVLAVVGLVSLIAGGAREARQRRIDWAANGDSILESVTYWTAVAKREGDTFAKLYEAEEEYRESHAEGPMRHKERAELTLQQVEAMDAARRVSEFKAKYLRLAPRKERKRRAGDWAPNP